MQSNPDEAGGITKQNERPLYKVRTFTKYGGLLLFRILFKNYLHIFVVAILTTGGVRPFLSNKYDITKHPNYKYLADADKRNTFDIEKYLSTTLKPKDDEVYTVFDVGEIDTPV